MRIRNQNSIRFHRPVSGSESATLRRVVATQEYKKAAGEHAEYDAGEGKVVLTGHPRIEQPSGTVTGEKITFWRDQKRMHVESLPAEERTRLIIYPDQMKSATNAPPEEPKRSGAKSDETPFSVFRGKRRDAVVAAIKPTGRVAEVTSSIRPLRLRPSVCYVELTLTTHSFRNFL